MKKNKLILSCMLLILSMLFTGCANNTQTDLSESPQSEEKLEEVVTASELVESAPVENKNEFNDKVVGYWCQVYEDMLGNVLAITSLNDINDQVRITYASPFFTFLEADAIVTEDTIELQTIYSEDYSGLTTWKYTCQDNVFSYCDNKFDIWGEYQSITEDEYNMYLQSQGACLATPVLNYVEAPEYLNEEWDLTEDIQVTTDEIYKVADIDPSHLTIVLGNAYDDYSRSINFVEEGLYDNPISGGEGWNYNGITENDYALEFYKKLLELVGPPNSIDYVASEPYEFNTYIEELDGYLLYYSREYNMYWEFDNNCTVMLNLTLSSKKGGGDIWFANNLTSVPLQ